MDDPTLVKAGP